jgi:hypothetical protein
LVAKGTPLKGDSIELSGHLNMEVWYTDKVGNGIDAGKLYQGDDFIMNVKLIHPGIRSNYEEMALTAIFPSGWKILNQRLNDVPNGDEYSFDYQDIRDDRIYTYFDLSRKGARNYKFQLNAAYEGTFYLPSVSCGAMYDNTVYAAKPGKWVQVRKR